MPLWLPSRRLSMLGRMMANFERDLGAAFTLEALEPAPSRRLTRCFYRDLLAREGEDDLAPVFTALHAATWAGVPGFAFEAEADGQCTFLFEVEAEA